MKQFIYIFLTVTLSCSFDSQDEKNDNGSIEGQVQDKQQALFNEWLTGLGISKIDIKDTIAERVYELWGHSYFVEDFPADTLLFWYPSPDSSYYLVTNYNRDFKHRVPAESPLVDFEFYHSSDQKMYLGFSIIDSLTNSIIDYYWYDSKTLFIWDQSNEEKILMKIEMGVDSMWTYAF